jgi:FlaA1/EpsC-like NDP-sugar epimerase
VFHAAAHKHVPVLESHPAEALRTNAVGTAHIVASATRHQVERLVFISTDKAVRPSSVMGASKRLGEQLVLSAQPPGGRYCAVRFGNVLGSRGSVIPTFLRQIEAGEPVTITDARMTRFFMSIREAVQLVLQSAAMVEGGEVYVLEMGEPVRIMDLAQRMIRLAGRRVGSDVEIRVTGARPGEKLVEELHDDADERLQPTSHPSIRMVVSTQPDASRLSEALARLSHLAARGDDLELRAELFRLVRGTGDASSHDTPRIPAQSRPRRVDLTAAEPTHIDLSQRPESPRWSPSPT